ncbi:EVE domain-containing protein, partial [Leptolyngbyaceae cyanobacterium UHCC 1019]
NSKLKTQNSKLKTQNSKLKTQNSKLPMNYWLIKSEPDVYGIADLERDLQTIWDGVRNYQARNFLKAMQPGDLAFYYHSNTAPLGIVGLAKIIQSSVIDPTQFDSSSPYYDPKATLENPRWHTAIVEFIETFPTLLTLETLRQTFTPDELWLVRPGNRLSVMPIPTDVAMKILKKARNGE